MLPVTTRNPHNLPAGVKTELAAVAEVRRSLVARYILHDAMNGGDRSGTTSITTLESQSGFWNRQDHVSY
jgi:hypothetical protein